MAELQPSTARAFSNSVLGCVEVSSEAIPISPSCLRTNRAGTIYFSRIDTATETWKSLWIFDCWGPEDAPGASYLPCCHELLGSSRVCWHWAAFSLQDFSILMGICIYRRCRGLWDPKVNSQSGQKAVVQFAPKLTKVPHVSVVGSLWVENPNPSKSVTKFPFQLGTRNSPCQIYRGEMAQNNSFIGVQINWFPCCACRLRDENETAWHN